MDSHFLHLPQGVICQILNNLDHLSDTAQCQLVCSELLDAVNVSVFACFFGWMQFLAVGDAASVGGA